ncbi:hypothetical protein GGS20DRAFT_567183 [Poronia punctata]|nr:hypothetical protein GGS20DRAFT_567183 [Poronia punctata]
MTSRIVILAFLPTYLPRYLETSCPGRENVLIYRATFRPKFPTRTNVDFRRDTHTHTQSSKTLFWDGSHFCFSVRLVYICITSSRLCILCYNLCG